MSIGNRLLRLKGKGAVVMAAKTSHAAIRRVLPVLTGLFAVVAITTLTDIVMHATGVFPPWGQRMADGRFILPLGYRIAFAVLGGYIAARLATDRPLSHAVVLGAIGFVLGTIGTVATAGQSAAYGPLWYSLLVTATAVPCSLAGAKLYKRAGTQRPMIWSR
jgi:hypothetical protein